MSRKVSCFFEIFALPICLPAMSLPVSVLLEHEAIGRLSRKESLTRSTRSSSEFRGRRWSQKSGPWELTSISSKLAKLTEPCFSVGICMHDSPDARYR